MLKLSFLNLLFSFFLVPLMMQCEDGREGPCDTYTNYNYQEDLCELSAKKSQYNKGEVVKFKFAIHSKLSLNGKQIDIFKETQSNNAFLRINLSELFENNIVSFVKGQKIDDNQFVAVYNGITDSYELEINVTLNRTGIYSFDSAATFQDRDYTEGNCVFVNISTNIKGSNLDDGRTEFVVN